MIIASQSHLQWMQDAWYVPIPTFYKIYQTLGYTSVTEGYLAEGLLKHQVDHHSTSLS